MSKDRKRFEKKKEREKRIRKKILLKRSQARVAAVLHRMNLENPFGAASGSNLEITP